MPKATTGQPQYTAKDTGVDTTNKQVIYWDPIAQGYKTAPYDWNNWSRGTREQAKYGWYTNSKGEHVYGLRPPTTHNVDTNGESNLVEGSDPNWKPQVTPDYNGMGTNGGQRTPTNTTDGSVPAWGGSNSHGVDGSVIPGGPADPTKWGPGGTDFWAPGAPGIGQPVPTTPATPGGGGGTGLFEKYVPGRDATWGLPTGGPGNNRDFYAKQFGQLMNQENSFNQRAFAAALRQAAADKAPTPVTDYKAMWANMGLPAVKTAQQAQDGQTYAWTPASWLKPGATTNLDIWNQSVISGKNAANPLALASPEMQGTSWSQMNPESLRAAYSGPQTSASWLSQLQNAWNNAWGRADLTPPAGGGPTAAPGYAAPV